MYRTKRERERDIVDLFGRIDETNTNVSPVTLGRRIHGWWWWWCIGIGIGIGECIRFRCWRVLVMVMKGQRQWQGLEFRGSKDRESAA